MSRCSTPRPKRDQEKVQEGHLPLFRFLSRYILGLEGGLVEFIEDRAAGQYFKGDVPLTRIIGVSLGRRPDHYSGKAQNDDYAPEDLRC